MISSWTTLGAYHELGEKGHEIYAKCSAIIAVWGLAAQYRLLQDDDC